MTSFSDAREAIRVRFNTLWTTTPKAFANVPFTPVAGTAFVALEIVGGDTFQAAVGSPSQALFREVGIIMLHIFTPVNEGSGLGQEFADDLAEIFRGKEFSNVLCFAPQIDSPTVADETGNFFRITLSIPFQFDATFDIIT